MEVDNNSSSTDTESPISTFRSTLGEVAAAAAAAGVDGVDSSGDEDTGYTPYSERPETFIVPIVFSIIFIVGCVGNGTLIYIFIKHRVMRNIPNT